MKIDVEVGDIVRWEDEAIVVNLFEGVRTPGGATGAVDTALDGLRWAHLDIAGTAWVEVAPDSPKKEYLPKGASGFGVRLLIRLLRDWKTNP